MYPAFQEGEAALDRSLERLLEARGNITEETLREELTIVSKHSIEEWIALGRDNPEQRIRGKRNKKKKENQKESQEEAL